MAKDYVVSVTHKAGSFLSQQERETIVETAVSLLCQENIAFTGHEQSESEVRVFISAGQKLAKAFVKSLSDCLKGSSHGCAFAIGLERDPIEEVEREEKTGNRRVKPFDVWAVPISSGQFGFVQILDKHPEHLYLTKVYDLVSPQVEAIETILKSSEMFPCVFSYIDRSVIKKEQLIWVGNRIVEFEYPLFRQSIMSRIQPDQTHSDWYLWSNENGYRFVGKLSNEQWDLQFLSGEPIGLIAKRIKHRIGPREEMQALANGWAHL